MSGARLLQRPIYGGVFGQGRYALASVPCIARGLYSTRYMVVEPHAGAVLSVADDKVEALAGARRVLHASGDLLNAANDSRPAVQLELWPDEPEQGCEAANHARPVSRRRREIFERSQGRCHYCGTALTLDGLWHVEHQLPRALGGGDDGLNLVAACVPCNLEKSDSTAIEFLTRAEIGGQP